MSTGISIVICESSCAAISASASKKIFRKSTIKANKVLTNV
jgi:hypothetical protein